MNVTHTDFVFIAVKDFAAAREFYEGMLGLECSETYGRHPGGEFETGNLTLLILQAEAFGLEFRTGTPIAFRVDDVATARAELEAQGVEFRGDILDTGVCHQAFFSDPDGNPLILHHRYAPAP